MMDITVCTLKELLSWAKDKMDTIPQLKYLRTLCKKYSKDTLWGTIPHMKNKRYLDLSDVLLCSKESIMSFVEKQTTTEDNSIQAQIVVVPDNVGQYQDLVAKIKAFIREYSSLLYGSLKRQNDSKRLYCIEQSFISDDNHKDPVPRRDLAIHIGAKNGRTPIVDNYLNDFINKCRLVLMGGDCIDGVSADQALVEEIAGLKQRVGKAISLSTFNRILGFPDGRTSTFVVSLLGMRSCSNSQVRIPSITEDMADFNRFLGSVINFFREEVIHIRFTHEFKAFLMSTFPKDANMRAVFEDFVRLSDEFVWSKDSNGDDEVALRWDLLEYDSPQVCWILYEANANSLATALHSTDIQRIYYRKARIYNLHRKTLSDNVLSTQQRGTCWRVINVGKSRYWMLRSSKKWSFSLDDYVSNYLRNDPTGSYGALEDMAKKDGVLNVYETATLKATFYRHGGQSPLRTRRQVGARTVFSADQKKDIMSFAEEVVGQNNNSMFFMDLASIVQGEYSEVAPGTLRGWLKNSDQYEFNVAPGCRQACISLRGKVRVTPLTNRQAIKQKAIGYLLKQKDYIEDKKTLYSIFEKDIPDGINKASALSAIFGDKDLFVRTEDSVQLTKDVVKERLLSTQSDLLAQPTVVNETRADDSYRKTPSYEWEQLKVTLKTELYTPFYKEPAFDKEKALNAMYYIMARGGQEVHNDSPFHYLLSALPGHYSRRLAADRELHLKEDCLLGLEPFLRNFYCVKYNKTEAELKEAIAQESSSNDKDAGLGRILSFFDNVLGLIPYKSLCPNDSVDRDIKDYIWAIKNNRNHGPAHRNNMIDTSVYSVEAVVHNFLCVCVFLASKL